MFLFKPCSLSPRISGTATVLNSKGVLLTYLAIGDNTSGDRVQHTRIFRVFVYGLVLQNESDYTISDKTYSIGDSVNLGLPRGRDTIFEAYTYRLILPSGQNLAQGVPGLSFSQTYLAPRMVA